MDGWSISFLLGPSAYFQGRTVSFRECISGVTRGPYNYSEITPVKPINFCPFSGATRVTPFITIGFGAHRA